MKKIFDAIIRYFKGVKKEIGRIRWTNVKDLIKYSISTLVIVTFFALFFYGIDMIISLLRSMI